MDKLLNSLLFFALSLSASQAFYEIGYESDHETVEIDGVGTTFATNGIRIGYKGNSNQFSIVNGAAAATEWFYLGMTSTENYHGDGIFSTYNTAQVSGEGSSWNAGSVRIGYGPLSENNTLRIDAGGEVTAATCLVGLFGGRSSRIVVSDAGSLLNVTETGGSGSLTVGYRAGGNSMIISNGASVNTASATLAYGHYIYECEENEILVTGSGSQWNSGDFTIGTGGYAMDSTFRIEDGAKVVSREVRLGDEGASGNQAVISGTGSEWLITGDLNVFAAQQADTANALIIENGAVLQVDGIVWLNDLAEERMTLSRIKLNEGGTLVLGSDFDASAGGFYFNKGSVLHAKGNLTGVNTVGADRQLIAHQVSGDLSVGGLWTMGEGITNGFISGNLALADTGLLAMEISASGSDRLEVQGDAALGGGLIITCVDGSELVYGTQLQLFDWGGEVSGSFDAVYCDALADGLSWDASALYTAGQLQVVPEPATAGLMGFSVLCLYLMRVNRGRFGTCRYSLRFRRSAIRTPAAEEW